MPDGDQTGAGRGAGGRAALHGAVLLFGVAGLFGKWIAAGPYVIVLARVTVAALALGALLAARRERPALPAGRDGWATAAGGGLLALHWLAFFQAIQVSTVAVGLLAYATAPAFATLLEPWWFRERLSFAALAASLISLAGVALMVPRWDAGEAVLHGAAWGVGAGASFALLSLLNRGLRRRHGALPLVFLQCAAAAAWLAPLLPWQGHLPAPADALRLVALGVVFTALAHGLYLHALRTIPARVATLAGNLEPVYGIALAAVLLGEIPTWRVMGGGCLILGAVAWITWRRDGNAAG